jgi:NNP family nitrate/nitrite transporter-like MFS transporter
MAANFSGILCLFWAFIYFWKAKDNLNRYSSSTAYETLRPSSNQDKWLFTFLMAPAYAAMGAAAWKLSMPVSYDIESSWFFMILCALAVGFIYHILKFWNISIKLTSKSSMRNGQFRYLCILSVVYALTFGSELAVISFFPQFLQNTFGLSVIQAGMWGATFPLMNLITRPSGGWLSDVWGRKRTLAFLIFGAVICYKFMGDIDSTWSLGAAISVSVLCSIFLQAGNGACFAIAPLVDKKAAGQLAGIIGAYGNIGAVVFLIVFSFIDESSFFYMLSAFAVVVFFSLYFLSSFGKEEPLLVSKGINK